MTYNELLNKTIKKSGLRNIDIVSKLNEIGVSITANYLSVLRNDSTKTASVKVSQAIAKVCGEDENLLVVQGELDKLGEALTEYITFTIDQYKSVGKQAYDIEGMPDEIKKKIQDEFLNRSEAELICTVLKEKEYLIEQNNDLISKAPKARYAIVPMSSYGDVSVVEADKLTDYI